MAVRPLPQGEVAARVAALLRASTAGGDPARLLQVCAAVIAMRLLREAAGRGGAAPDAPPRRPTAGRPTRA